MNHNFASVWFGIRLLMSRILRLVHELHLVPTTFLLPLHVLILIVSFGVGDTTSSAYNAMVLLFTRCCCRRHPPIPKKQKKVNDELLLDENEEDYLALTSRFSNIVSEELKKIEFLSDLYNEDNNYKKFIEHLNEENAKRYLVAVS